MATRRMTAWVRSKQEASALQGASHVWAALQIRFQSSVRRACAWMSWPLEGLGKRYGTQAETEVSRVGEVPGWFR